MPHTQNSRDHLMKGSMKLMLRSETSGFADRSCKREIHQERRIRGKMVVELLEQNELEGEIQ